MTTSWENLIFRYFNAGPPKILSNANPTYLSVTPNLSNLMKKFIKIYVYKHVAMHFIKGSGFIVT